MILRHHLTLVPTFLLSAGLLGAGAVDAQSHACEPGAPPLGVLGPEEICVVVYDDAVPVRNTAYFRGASPLGVPATPGPVVVGEYEVDLVAVSDFGPLAIEVGLAGTVTRASPGNLGITVMAQTGWGPPLDVSFITLNLVGDATGTSRVVVGGAAGKPRGTVPAEDLLYSAAPQPIPVANFGVAAFDESLTNQLVVPGAVAAGVTVDLHINEVGVTIDIPAGTELKHKDKVFEELGGDGEAKPHFQCYSLGEMAQKGRYSAGKLSAAEEQIVVTLADQFGFTETRIGKATRLCTPVSKNEEEVPDPDLHLVCYEIVDGQAPNETVLTSNQFGEDSVFVRESKELCVPSTKKRTSEEEQKQQQAERAEGKAGTSVPSTSNF